MAGISIGKYFKLIKWIADAVDRLWHTQFTLLRYDAQSFDVNFRNRRVCSFFLALISANDNTHSGKPKGKEKEKSEGKIKSGHLLWTQSERHQFGRSTSSKSKVQSGRYIQSDWAQGLFFYLNNTIPSLLFEFFSFYCFEVGLCLFFTFPVLFIFIILLGFALLWFAWLNKKKQQTQFPSGIDMFSIVCQSILILFYLLFEFIFVVVAELWCVMKLQHHNIESFFSLQIPLKWDLISQLLRLKKRKRIKRNVCTSEKRS